MKKTQSEYSKIWSNVGKPIRVWSCGESFHETWQRKSALFPAAEHKYTNSSIGPSWDLDFRTTAYLSRFKWHHRTSHTATLNISLPIISSMEDVVASARTWHRRCCQWIWRKEELETFVIEKSKMYSWMQDKQRTNSAIITYIIWGDRRSVTGGYSRNQRCRLWMWCALLGRIFRRGYMPARMTPEIAVHSQCQVFFWPLGLFSISP